MTGVTEVRVAQERHLLIGAERRRDLLGGFAQSPGQLVEINLRCRFQMCVFGH
jgi:hypothetical protein